MMNSKKQQYEAANLGLGSYLLIGGICACVVFAAYFTFYTPAVNHEDLPVADTGEALSWYEEKHTWKLKSTSDEEFKSVITSVSFKRFKNEFLPRFLVVRPPGSEKIKEVRRFIEETMQNLQWSIEEDTFTEKPPDPYSETEFTNVIATLNPNAKRRLVLACHYDSKITPEGFIGATDSSVPCAMMLEIATALQKFLAKMPKSSDLTLQLVFFDGEEAFVRWTRTDSIYGARHLAEKWSGERWPVNSKSDRTVLDSIDVLVLLDLLGEANPRFYDYYHAHSTSKNNHFRQLSNIESRLKDKKTYFVQRASNAAIEDDHIPFLQKNVPILHIIPSPFPHQWHKIGDDGKNLDDVTMLRLMKIFAVFVTEYLHLQIF